MKFDLSPKEFIALKQYVRSKWLFPHSLKILDEFLMWSVTGNDVEDYHAYHTLPVYVERAIIDWMKNRNDRLQENDMI